MAPSVIRSLGQRDDLEAQPPASGGQELLHAIADPELAEGEGSVAAVALVCHHTAVVHVARQHCHGVGVRLRDRSSAHNALVIFVVVVVVGGEG